MGSVEEGSPPSLKEGPPPSLEKEPPPSLKEGPSPSLEEGPPLSFEDLGIPLVPRTRSTPLGKIRSLASLDRLEWAFLLASLLAVLTTLGLGIARLASLPPHAEDRVFVWLLFLTAGFSLVYAVNGVFREQVYELLAYALTALVLTMYALFNYLDPETPRGAIKLARLIVAGLLSPPLVFIAISLAARYSQQGAFVFRTVGANMALQAACRRVLTAQSLLKLDAQLALSAVLLVLHDTSGSRGITVTEAAVLGAGSVLTLLWWLAAYAALRWELRRLLFAVLVAAALEPAYIVWRLVTEERVDGVVLECERAAAALALLVRLLLVGCLVSCLPGFGLGVSQHMYPGRETAGSGGRPPRYGAFGDTPTPPRASDVD